MNCVATYYVDLHFCGNYLIMLVCIKGQNIVADYYFAIDHLRSSYYDEMSVYLCIGSEV
jgi:hypothetical protein